MTRPLKIRINLEAISANTSLAKSLAPAGRLVACVKADAYGHGLLEVSAALEHQVDALGVACLEEAQLLRRAGINAPVLLLEGCFSGAELEEAKEQDCWTVLHNQEQLEAFLTSKSRPDNLWLKLDTGMHRLGFNADELPGVIERLQDASESVQLHFMTHFACADETNNSFTRQQLDHFALATRGFDFPCSLANSAALLAWPATRSDWNRPGFMLYGINPLDTENESTSQLLPAMSLTSEVISVRDLASGEGVGYNHAWRAFRDSRIAVVACGYGDGYPRQLRNGTPVLVNGQRAMTVGHIAMDMLMLDVTEIGLVRVGAEVELWGENLSVMEVARHSDMSPYELLTRMPRRAARVYSGS